MDRKIVAEEAAKLIAQDEHGILGKCKFLGQNIWKFPTDIWNYQEIIWENKPDILIETGAFAGGSAWYFAHLFDMMGNGKIFSIDIKKESYYGGDFPQHHRIEYLLGQSSTDEFVVSYLKRQIADKKVMVILDSDHTKGHVLNELRMYNEMVSVGQYMVVEDTGVNGHPVWVDFGPGPMEALEEFMKENSDFIIDESIDSKFLFTLFPKGWLKKIK